MNKLIIIGILFFICSLTAVIGQTANPEDLQTLNKIAQEHQNTRKYFSDEFTRQKTQMFKDFDDRANYYEKTFDDMITNTIFKLALLWGGIMLFFTSFNNFLRNRIEKKRYKKLKENVIEEVLQRIKIPAQNPQNVSISKQTEKKPVIRGETGYSVDVEKFIAQAPIPQQQMSARKEKKVIKQLGRIDKSMEQIHEKRAKLQSALGITPLHTNNTEYIYEQDGLEVNY